MSKFYTDAGIEQEIDGNRWQAATAHTQYRQMLAMEKIADLLEEIAYRLKPPMIDADGAVEIGPALQHSRRKRFSMPET